MLFTPFVESDVLNEVYGMAIFDKYGDGVRVGMDISELDYNRYHANRDDETGVAITDRKSGVVVSVTRADCGAGCRCAAQIVEVVKNPVEWNKEA